MNNTMKKIPVKWTRCLFYVLGLLSIFCSSLFLSCSYSPTVAGGVSEETNSIVGKVFKPDGTPAVNTQVKLISSLYDPVNDAGLPVSRIDTTDENGQYLLQTSESGTYNILGLDLSKKTRLLIRDIAVDYDTFIVVPDTLRQTGSIYIRLPDSTVEIGGHLFIRGTDIYATVDNTALQTGYILIDSVPAGQIPNIVYTDAEESVTLIDSVQVISGSTVHASGLMAIYYSVGTNTGDLKSGAPLITISSGSAVLSQPQPDNVGVGDVIEYGPDNIKAFISGRSGSTQYSILTAKGIIPSNVAGAAVHSIRRAFNSLDDALDTEDGGACACDLMHLNTADLVASNCQLIIACYADGIDTKEAIVKGWTTGAKNYIRIFTPVLSSEVGTGQRHAGKWDNSAYQLAVTATGNYQSCIAVVVPHVRIEGLQFFISSDYLASVAIEYNQQINGELYVSNCITRGYTTTNISKIGGIAVYTGGYSGSNIKIWNNIIYDFFCPDTTAGQRGIVINAEGCSGIVCNNTLYNCRIGIAGWLRDFTVINNIVINSDNGFFNWDSVGTNIDYNISDIPGDFPGTHSINGVEVSFVDSTGRDLHIAAGDTTARDNGMTDPAQGLFTDDIDGQERVGSWDIGADERF
jgi:hypothetical protein